MDSSTGKENCLKRHSFEISEEEVRAPFIKRKYKNGVKIRQIVWVRESASIITEHTIEGPCTLILPPSGLDPDTTYIELPPGPSRKKQK